MAASSGRRRDLALPVTTPTLRRWMLLRIIPTSLVFLLTIPVAISQPALAK